MNISKREKVMLSSLGIVLVGVLYYQFIYTKQIEKVDTLEIKRNEVETKYNEVMDTIMALEQKQNRISSMYSTLDMKASKYYSYIVQENIILDINKMLIDSELTGDLSFTELEVKEVEKNSSIDTNKQNGSINTLVEKYENIGKSLETQSNIDIQNNNLVEEDLSKTDEENINEDTQSSETSATIEQMYVSLTYKGTYSQLKSFIKKVERSNKKIVITNCSITTDADNKVSGSMNLEFYAIPSIGDIKSYYENWDLDSESGKEIPFNSMNAPVGYKGSSEKNIESDFVIAVKPKASDIPTVTIGKGEDTKGTTYIESDNSGIESIEIELKNDRDKYYYSYKTSTKSYPGSNKVEKFTPIEDVININISSQERLNSDDKSGIKLTVKNNTDRKININVIDDDKERPRVSISGIGSNISVVNK